VKIFSLFVLVSTFCGQLAFGSPGKRGDSSELCINGEFQFEPSVDSIDAVIWPEFISEGKEEKSPKVLRRFSIFNHKFSVEFVGRRRSFYFSLGYRKRGSEGRVDLLHQYFFEGHGVVRVKVYRTYELSGSEDSLAFSGESASVLAVQYKAVKMEARFKRTYVKRIFQEVGGELDSLNFMSYLKLSYRIREESLKEELDTLEHYAVVVPPAVFKVVQANAASRIWGDDCYFLQYLYRRFVQDGFNRGIGDIEKYSARARLRRFYDDAIETLGVNNFGDSDMVRAKDYLSFIRYRAAIRSFILDERPKEVYLYLKVKYKGRLLQELLTEYLFNSFEYIEGADSLASDALGIVTDEELASIIRDLRLHQAPGAKAFNFELPDENGRMVRLSDFKGRVVFMDFWFTGCSACEFYYRTLLSKVEPIFRGSDSVVFISISVDESMARWINSVKGGHYTSEIAVNLFTGGRGPDDSVIRYYNIEGYPRQLILDRDGRLFENNGTDLYSVENIRSKIREAFRE